MFQKIKDEYQKSPSETILILLFTSIVFGFVIPGAHVPISIGSIGFFLLGIQQLYVNRSESRNWVILLPALLFVLFVLSGINSENTDSWLNFVRIKLTFLAIPVGFYGLKNISRKMLETLLSIFVIVMSLSSVFVLLHYAMHYEEVNAKLGTGTPVPTPHTHVHYSALLTVAFFCALWLRNQSRYWLFFALHILITLHILSVRGALAALYAGLLFLALRLVFSNRKKWGAAILAAVAALFILGYSFVPSMKARIDFMVWDIQQWQEGNIAGNSDASRIATLLSGWTIWKENPLFGVGVGDMKTETDSQVMTLFPTIDSERMPHKMPHNQFLWIACATGTLGLFVFVFSWVFPIWYFRKKSDWLFWVIQVLFFIPCLVQYELETQTGGTFYVLFQCLFYSFLSSKKTQEEV